MKKIKTQGRHGQLNKALRLHRRSLGQWRAQPQQVRSSPTTRYTLAEAEWQEGV